MSSLTSQDAIHSIDIDVGGTFTDLVLTLDGERIITALRGTALARS